MKIFVASTSERLDIAKKLAAALAKEGLTVVRWWTAFRSGDVTIDRLLDIASQVDGALFILDAADKTSVRGAECLVPRDNLVFEYGMFLQRLGKKHCYLLVDHGAKLPTDIAGLTFQDLYDNVTAMAEDIAAHFRAIGSPPPVHSYGSIVPILSDTHLLDIELGRIYDRNYRMRSLYLGTEGAKCWMDVITGDDYELSAEKTSIKNTVVSLLQNSRIAASEVFSFGPGHGEVERAILMSSAASQCKCFIPVDINEVLLKVTIHKCSDHVTLPFAVQGDFEGGFAFVHGLLAPFASEQSLFVMTGNTFGNLDGTETQFARNLVKLMPNGSHFLSRSGSSKERAGI